MSKAFREVRKTKQAPHLERFQQRAPANAEQEKRRLRAITEQFQDSAKKLADAPKNISKEQP